MVRSSTWVRVHCLLSISSSNCHLSFNAPIPMCKRARGFFLMLVELVCVCVCPRCAPCFCLAVGCVPGRFDSHAKQSGRSTQPAGSGQAHAYLWNNRSSTHVFRPQMRTVDSVSHVPFTTILPSIFVVSGIQHRAVFVWCVFARARARDSWNSTRLSIDSTEDRVLVI